MSSLKQISQKSLKTYKNFNTETPSVYPKHIEITSQTHKINNQDEKDIEHTKKKEKLRSRSPFSTYYSTYTPKNQSKLINPDTNFLI